MLGACSLLELSGFRVLALFYVFIPAKCFSVAGRCINA
jgi:hypothetical protein